MAKLHLLLQAFTLLFSLLASNVLASVHVGTGIATFYTDQSRLACPGAENHGDSSIAAVSSTLWNDGHVCGKKMTVQCIGPVHSGDPNPCKGKGTLTVTVSDFCAKCRGLIDLTVKGFESIAEKSAGEVVVSYKLF